MIAIGFNQNDIHILDATTTAYAPIKTNLGSSQTEVYEVDFD